MVIGTLTDYVIASLLDKHKDKLPDPVVELITSDDSLQALLKKEILPKTLENVLVSYLAIPDVLSLQEMFLLVIVSRDQCWLYEIDHQRLGKRQLLLQWLIPHISQM